MNRKRARHLHLELSRRIYLREHGTLKGWGKIAKFYNDDWRPKFRLIYGYKGCWNYDIMVQVRKDYGM